MQRAAALRRSVAATVALLACGFTVWHEVGSPERLMEVVTHGGRLGADPAEVVVAGLALAAEALTSYLLLTVALVVLAAIPGAVGRSSRRLLTKIALPGLRALLETALGTLLVAQSALAAPQASASERPITMSATVTVAVSATSATTAPPTPPAALPLVPLPRWLGGSEPAEKGGGAGRDAARRATPGSAAALPGRTVSYTVVPGDCLWTIASVHLPPQRRTEANIARYWPQIYAGNRDIVGGDPDLLRPGWLLSLPPFRP